MENFANFNFSSRNRTENVKDIDFEDPMHPFTRRRIMLKKGIQLDQGFYIIELSKTNSHFYLVAYDIQNSDNKFVKTMSYF